MALQLPLTAGLISGLFATSTFADPTPETQRDKIKDCMAEAIDNVDIPEAQSYYDPGDNGFKKYIESDSVFAGISAFLNPYNDDAEANTDKVYFQTKYYDEKDGTDFIDMVRSISLTLTAGDIVYQDDAAAHSNNDKHAFSLLDDDAPEYTGEETKAINWAHDAAGSATIAFTICMNLEPYTPSMMAGTRPLQPAVFPELNAE